MSNNLDLSQVAAAQNQKEITINDQAGEIDAAVTETLDVDFTSGNVTLTAAQFRESFEFNATNLSAARDLTCPAQKRFFLVNNEAGTAILTVKVGATSAALAIGQAGLFYSDGSVNGLAAVGGGGAGGPIELGGFVGGVPTVSIVLFRYLAADAVSFVADLVGSVGHNVTAPSAQTDFDVQVNGVSKGTMRFASSANTSTFLTNPTFSLVSGDRFDIVAPANLNGLADLSFTFAAARG